MSLKRNLLANYLGQGWVALMGLAFVPVYIRYLGIEAYGLIGLFAVLQAWLSLLDLGMTPTLNREVARYTAKARSAESLRDLVRTFEIICVGVALSIVIAMLFVSDWLASDWLNARRLPQDVVSHALALMGLVAALRFVEGLYRGAILGLQMHVWLNAVTAALATLRALGAVGVLAWWEASIQAFFWWQALISGVAVLILGFGVHRHLPRTARPAVFSPRSFKDAWSFAGGMFLTTILALMITQMDKVLLSRLLSLDAFGTYTFAAAVAGVLGQFVGPIAQVYYPRLTELVAGGDGTAVAAAYHQGAQFMSVVLVPAGLVLIAFGEPLLRLWTGNPALANDAALIVAILAVGTVFNGWMHVPYVLQLAYGWSSFAAWVNLVAVIVLVPAIFWVTPRFGPSGAAWVWVAVNLGYVLIAVHFMHFRLLPGEKSRWYLHDLLLPTAAAGAVVGISHMAHPDGLEPVVELLWISVTGLAAYAAALAGAPKVRAWAFGNRLRPA